MALTTSEDDRNIMVFMCMPLVRINKVDSFQVRSLFDKASLLPDASTYEKFFFKSHVYFGVTSFVLKTTFINCLTTGSYYMSGEPGIVTTVFSAVQPIYTAL